MKAAPFSYLRPDSLDEACEALAADPEARVLAGGQTLVPMLAMRLSRPSLLVDVSRLDALMGIEEAAEGIVIKAATRQSAALKSEIVRRKVPLLAKALPNVGHPATRSRGTLGGSVAHGDPSAEISLAATILGAEIVYREKDEELTFPAEEFFLGPTLTAAPASGCLIRIVFPRRPDERTGAGFHEIASRPGDYAFASAGAQITLDEAGGCVEALLGIGSVSDVPVAVDVTCLVGSRLCDAGIGEAVEAALVDLETVDDLHATASYRRRAAGELARRALREARDEALGEPA